MNSGILSIIFVKLFILFHVVWESVGLDICYLLVISVLDILSVPNVGIATPNHIFILLKTSVTTFSCIYDFMFPGLSSFFAFSLVIFDFLKLLKRISCCYFYSELTNLFSPLSTCPSVVPGSKCPIKLIYCIV